MIINNNNNNYVLLIFRVEWCKITLLFIRIYINLVYIISYNDKKIYINNIIKCFK